jgi:signal transduction histidine kinase
MGIGSYLPIFSLWATLLTFCLGVAVVMRSITTMYDRRSTFVAAVTHELRTPLTTFQLYTDLMDTEVVQDPKIRREYLQTLRDQASRLHHLVENMLHFAQLEALPKQVRPIAIAWDDWVGRLMRSVAMRADSTGVQVEWEVQDQSMDFCSDPLSIEQIVLNLVDNACKYGLPQDGSQPRLRISVASSQVAASGRWWWSHLLGKRQMETCVLVTISDFGQGMTPEARRKLFRPFSKSVHHAAGTAPGIGLGLSLCDRLARRLGGRLTCSDNQPHGTRFILQIPIQSSHS